MSTAEEIRNRLKKKPRKFVEVVADGESYWIQSLSELENSDANAKATDAKAGRFDRARYLRELFVRSLVTGENGERVYSDRDQSEVIGMQNYILQPIIDAIDKLNSGMDVGKQQSDSTKTED